MKRNNELCDQIKAMLESDNLSEEQKKAFKELLTEYEWATYKEHNDRHEFFRNQVEKMVNDFGFHDEELAKAIANDNPSIDVYAKSEELENAILNGHLTIKPTFQYEKLAKERATDHPTLQQSFMRMVCLFIHEMAQKKYFDDRNKGSVALAKELDPIIKEKGYLPCI